MSEFLENIKWQWEMRHSFDASKWEELFRKLEEAEQLQTEVKTLKNEVALHKAVRKINADRVICLEGRLAQIRHLA